MKVDNTSGRRNPGTYVVSIGANDEGTWQPVRDRCASPDIRRTEAPMSSIEASPGRTPAGSMEIVAIPRRTESADMGGQSPPTATIFGKPLAHGRPEGGDYDGSSRRSSEPQARYCEDARGRIKKQASARRRVVDQNKKVPRRGRTRYFLSPTSRQAGAIGERFPPVGGQPRGSRDLMIRRCVGNGSVCGARISRAINSPIFRRGK